MARTDIDVVLFKGPEDGLVVAVGDTEPCPQPGYHRTDQKDRMGRTVFEWRPTTTEETDK